MAGKALLWALVIVALIGVITNPVAVGHEITQVTNDVVGFVTHLARL